MKSETVITILGAGVVGTAMAIDLAKENYQIQIVDISEHNFAKLNTFNNITTITSDLSNVLNINTAIAESDLVINALPGFLGYNACKTIIESKINFVDIAFFPEDPTNLKNLALSNQVIGVVDAGVAPGLSNILVSSTAQQLDQIESVKIYVGGLPKLETLPEDSIFQYRAVFSPIDVIEEYVRPARLVENGELVSKQALTEPEDLEFDKIGTLQAFNTDGLRTLIDSIKATNMSEKTLRYPGHLDKVKLLREIGYFSSEPLIIGKHQITPVDLTAKLLLPLWKLQKTEEDFTVMRIIVEGESKGQSKIFHYELYDEYDSKTETTSMARTTGYTATSVAEAILNGKFTKVGLSAPEELGKDQNIVKFITERLAARSVRWQTFN
ncbi:MAG: saccharopine dehydrogenase NADP-binding domain-containing protein [Deltaproteobacteria bacterium]|nr:saccharopine dehydrogenase NADP-binding domain-containing protein [Deltaproteobacteria bacterium]